MKRIRTYLKNHKRVALVVGLLLVSPLEEVVVLGGGYAVYQAVTNHTNIEILGERK